MTALLAILLVLAIAAAAGAAWRLRRQQAQLEEAKRRGDRLESELAALTYSLSHDLRSPLRSVDGFSEALAEDYRDTLDEQALDYLQRIRDASAKMQHLIAGLLELSQVSRGELRPERVDVTGIAESIADALRKSDPSRNVTFVIEPGMTVTADGRLLRIALEKLLDNAWKFTSRHPSARIEVGIEVRGGRRSVFVRDDGAGFDEMHAGKLFAPYQRLHSDREFPGDGVGLAVVRRIVQRHGGEVAATGAVERGATVHLQLGP